MQLLSQLPASVPCPAGGFQAHGQHSELQPCLVPGSPSNTTLVSGATEWFGSERTLRSPQFCSLPWAWSGPSHPLPAQPRLGHPEVQAPALLMPRSRREEEEEELRLKRLLAQLEPSCLSRPARMLLSVARSRALRSRTSTRADPELRDRDAGGSPAPGELGLCWVQRRERPSQGHPPLAALSSSRFPPLQVSPDPVPGIHPPKGILSC